MLVWLIARDVSNKKKHFLLLLLFITIVVGGVSCFMILLLVNRKNSQMIYGRIFVDFVQLLTLLKRYFSDISIFSLVGEYVGSRPLETLIFCALCYPRLSCRVCNGMFTL